MDDGSARLHIHRGVAPRERGFGTVRLVRSVYVNRSLVWEMARRELTDLHAGHAAGGIWLFVHPLLLFTVYAVLFTLVFRVRIGDRGPSDYLIYLFSGLGPWLLTQDIFARAPTIIIANIGIVKKVLFPAEVLVGKSIASSLVAQLVLQAVVIIYIVVSRERIPATFLLLPVLFALHLLLIWGFALFLAALTPYMRDINELMRVFLTINIYLIPVMYVPDMMPHGIRFLLTINPFSYLIWCYQDLLYFNEIAHPEAWVVLPIFSLASLVVGSYVFVRLRHVFASVL